MEKIHWVTAKVSSFPSIRNVSFSIVSCGRKTVHSPANCRLSLLPTDMSWTRPESRKKKEKNGRKKTFGPRNLTSKVRKTRTNCFSTHYIGLCTLGRWNLNQCCESQHTLEEGYFAFVLQLGSFSLVVCAACVQNFGQHEVDTWYI